MSSQLRFETGENNFYFTSYVYANKDEEVGRFEISKTPPHSMSISVDENYQKKGISMTLIFNLLNYISSKTELPTNTYFYIDTDASNGFWDHLGMEITPEIDPNYGYEKRILLSDLIKKVSKKSSAGFFRKSDKKTKRRTKKRTKRRTKKHIKKHIKKYRRSRAAPFIKRGGGTYTSGEFTLIIVRDEPVFQKFGKAWELAWTAAINLRTMRPARETAIRARESAQIEYDKAMSNESLTTTKLEEAKQISGKPVVNEIIDKINAKQETKRKHHLLDVATAAADETTTNLTTASKDYEYKLKELQTASAAVIAEGGVGSDAVVAIVELVPDASDSFMKLLRLNLNNMKMKSVDDVTRTEADVSAGGRPGKK